MKLITEEKIKELEKDESLKSNNIKSIQSKYGNNLSIQFKYGNNWIVSICLWLFLGHLGAHRLYLGLKSGIVQLIFTFIWLPTILIVLLTSLATIRVGAISGFPLVSLIIGCVCLLAGEIWQIVDFFLIMFGKIRNKSGEQIKVFRSK